LGNWIVYEDFVMMFLRPNRKKELFRQTFQFFILADMKIALFCLVLVFSMRCFHQVYPNKVRECFRSIGLGKRYNSVSRFILMKDRLGECLEEKGRSKVSREEKRRVQIFPELMVDEDA
jgi:hypothetical protein